MGKGIPDILNRYLAIGSLSSDSEDLRLKKASLLWIPLIIGIAAFLWGMIYIAFERPLSASIPLSYAVISVLNVWHLAKTKNITPLLLTQLTLVLLLPFLLMWSLGGFAAGSFVFIWAFYAPITALIYLSEQHATRWLGGFIALTIISAVIDSSLKTLFPPMPTLAIELFFILNISAGSLGIFFIIKHFMDSKEKNANALLRKEHQALLQTTVELKKANEQFEQLAHHDSLTDLINRNYLSRRLQECIGFAERQQQEFSVLFIDLDKFKHINDTYGHPIGDQVLITASKRLKQIARAKDVVARFGGDEFVFIVQDSTANDASHVARRILNIFTTPFEVNDVSLHISPSIGIARFPKNGQTPTALLKNADTAMYRAKHDGRNNYSYYSAELTTEVTRRVHLENMLRDALMGEELTLRFQLQVDTLRKQIYGVEVLLRWHQADEGFIPPDLFIPIAEESGQIYDIGKWVLKQSCLFMQRLLAEGYDLDHISVNVSGNQFLDKRFITDVSEILAETGLQGKHLELELTESVIMNDHTNTLEALHTLSNMGIALSVDDFGTGYSSLSYLKKLPVKTIKIDRSFVRDICHDDDDKAITKSIIALGKALNLNIIAEGVEDIEQLHFLSTEDCSLIQGYLFSKPITADELLTTLKQPQLILNKMDPTKVA